MDAFPGTIFKYIPILLFVVLISCKPNGSLIKGTVTIKGSDTMVNLSQGWAENFMKIKPYISVRITGGGSGTGIASLLNETADIANISRELNNRELDLCKKLNVNPIQFKVALDGIAIVVNPKNNVDSITIDQVSKIFSGMIKNWAEFGGPDRPIILYGRESSSGTHEFFKEKVLNYQSKTKNNDFSRTIQVLQGTAALAEAVKRDEWGISYGGVGYFTDRTDLKLLKIKKTNESSGISPIANEKLNYDVIWKGDYPLTRYLYIYSNGQPRGYVKEFIEFILSAKGQEIVKGAKYIPLPDLTN